MNKYGPYKSFSRYILRVPLLSFSKFEELTNERDISDEKLKIFCSSPLIKESIFLASVPLFNELERWLAGEVQSEKKIDKLKISLLKYLSRMCSRCTPYGLFAGVATGKFGNDSQIELQEPVLNGRSTRLDMHCLSELAHKLSAMPVIKKQLRFYANNSTYTIGNKIRYVEYSYRKNSRIHHISEVDGTSYLREILNIAKEGKVISDLTAVLKKHGASEEQAMEFIEELIGSQLLVSEMEPTVSGPDALAQILHVLENFHDIEDITAQLHQIKGSLQNIDTSLGNEIKSYVEVKSLVNNLIGDMEIGSLFQADLFIKAKKNNLSHEIPRSVLKGFALLNKITPPMENSIFNQFKNAFFKRYEHREVSLAHVMDSEIGIGYVQNKNYGDINPLLDNIEFHTNNSNPGLFLTPIQQYFYTVIKDANQHEKEKISIREKDFEHLVAKWDDLPKTVSFTIEVLREGQNHKVKLNHGASYEAADMLGRFHHIDNEIGNHINELLETESSLKPGYIIAEIVHLPESRTGNVLMRPDFRPFEIPYLSRSLKKIENQIFIDDLMISCRNDELVLRCRKNNSLILPRLTTAHNYSNNSLPIYHFLSDFKNQGMRYGVSTDLGVINSLFDFIPRIEYDNIILKEATWILKSNQLKAIYENAGDDDAVFKESQKLRTLLKFPKIFMLKDGSSDLLINFENLSCIKMFINMVKNKPVFEITEFIHICSDLVKKGNEHYTNEFILAFYNDQQIK